MKTNKNMQVVQSDEELQDFLSSVAASIKNQVLLSPTLGQPQLGELRSRLSSISDELNGLQQDVVMPDGLNGLFPRIGTNANDLHLQP